MQPHPPACPIAFSSACLPADINSPAASPRAKPCAPQVESLGGESKQLAVCVGTAVLIATLHELRPPTLANLLGALAIDKALAAACASNSSSSSSQGGGGLPAPKPAAAGAAAAGGGAAGVNPAALAALRALHPDEIERLAAPFGGAARPMELQVELEAPCQPGQWLVPASRVAWRPVDQATHEQVAAEERRVWQAVQHGELGGDGALQKALAPLLQLRRASGLPLSPRLMCRLLVLAAGGVNLLLLPAAMHRLALLLPAACCTPHSASCLPRMAAPRLCMPAAPHACARAMMIQFHSSR